MKPWMLWLAAFLVTATVAGRSRSTQAEEQHRNKLLWLKRLIGVPMLLLAVVYGYFVYRAQELGWGEHMKIPIIRGAGWLLWGLGLVTRIEIADDSTLEQIYKAWSNQRRGFLLWVGFLIVAAHTGYLVSQLGPSGLRVDGVFVEECVAAHTAGSSG